MRINNPKLFNGDLLATQKQITEWLQGTATQVPFGGQIAASRIPITGIDITTGSTSGVYQIYANTIKMSSAEGAKTISAAIDELSSAIAGVKAYAVSGSNAIDVTTDGGTAKEVFTVGLTLDGNSLTNTISGLKVTDGYVDGIVSGTTAADLATGVKVVKLTGSDVTSGYAASYAVKFNGVQLGQKIDIPKDKFVKSAEYIAELTADQVIEAGGTEAGFEVGDSAIKFTIYVSADGTETSLSTFYVNVSSLVDKYTGVSGVAINGTQISGVVDGSSDSYFTVGATGFKLTGVSARFDGIDDNIEYISSFVSGLPAADTALSNKIDYVSGFVSGLPAADTALSNKIDYVSGFVSGLPAADTALSNKIDYVSSFVSGLPADITDVNNDVEYISSFVSGLPAADTALSNKIDYVSGVVSGHTEDISYISGVVHDLEEQVTSTDKFISAAVLPVSGKEDTLYYTPDGQTAIWDNGGWQTISMEAITDLNGTVDNTTTATSQAIKSYVTGYVDGAITPVRSDLNTVSGDLDAVEEELPKKVEIFEITKSATGAGNFSTNVNGRVIAVYDGSMDQVYPDITYTSGNPGSSLISISALTSAEIFTIIYTTTAATKVNA